MDKTIIIQIVNFLILATIVIGYSTLVITAIITLIKRKITGLPFAIWIFIVFFFPFLGALSVLIVKYQKSSLPKTEK